MSETGGITVSQLNLMIAEAVRKDPRLRFRLCSHITAEPGQTVVIRDPVPQHFLFDA